MITKKIAVIGAGYWGKNLVRNYAEMKVLDLVCDASADNLKKVNALYPAVKTTQSINDVLDNNEIDAVVIATPAETHYDIVKMALLSGKDVFVEKPLSLMVQQGDELVRIAKEKLLILMVGHVLQYHPAIIKLKNIIDKGELGKLEYIYSNRLNFGKIRREENILWSFAPHDISVILSLINKEPLKVSATGLNYLHPEIADTTMSQLTFPDGINAHIFVSWLHPFKEQKMVIIGDKQMAVFDDTQPWDQKLVLYPHKVVWHNQVPQAEKADGISVILQQCEPLRAECEHFVKSITQRTQALTSGDEGLNVLNTLSRLQNSLDSGGRWLPFKQSTESYFVHPTSEVGDGVSVGNGTKIWQNCNILSNSKIGSNCSFGQNCVVGPNVTIGNQVKAQNNISIYDGVEIEDDVFLGPSMVFTNVMNPRSFIVRKDQFKKTRLKKGCSIGANATIVCGTILGYYSFVAAGAVVTKDVKDYALVAGTPARQIGWVSKAGNTLKFDSNNIAHDAEDDSYYQLEGDQINLILESKLLQEEAIH